MNPSFSFRPVPLIPFLAADGALLLTALLIAWRTPGEITGGALMAVVLCAGLGAVLAVLPWVLNDAREREAALAERQRELADLVKTSTESAARWGTQWAAAATGLEDAAQLASRSLAAAERLPGVFQEKAEAWSERLAAAEREALARVEKTAQLEAVMGARAEQMSATVAAFQRTLAEFGRVETGLKEQRAAIAAVLTEAPAAVQQLRTVREELDGRVAEIPVAVAAQTAQVTRVAGEAETRLGATVEALIGDVVAKLERVAALPEPQVAPAPVVQSVVAKPKVVVDSEAIMDPFLIPDDGYASLAEAMDARNA